MNHGEETMTIINEEGQEVECQVLLTFDSPEPKYDRSYVVFHEVDAEDEDGIVEIQALAFRPNEDGDGGALLPIETEEEWDMVEEVIGAFIAEDEDTQFLVEEE